MNRAVGLLLLSAIGAGLVSPAISADPMLDIPMDEPVMVEETGWYFSVFAGGAWPGFGEFASGSLDPEIDTEFGWTAGVAAGARLMEMVRAEVELSHISQGYTVVADPTYAGVLDTTYLLGNIWLDMDTGSGISPYIGGGVGVAFVSLDDVDGWFDSSSVFEGYGLAYQVGAGVRVPVTENVDVDLGYRFKGVAGAELENFRPVDGTLDLGNHIVQLGLHLHN
jgi:opacity protein-like surface antigen